MSLSQGYRASWLLRWGLPAKDILPREMIKNNLYYFFSIPPNNNTCQLDSCQTHYSLCIHNPSFSGLMICITEKLQVL